MVKNIQQGILAQFLFRKRIEKIQNTVILCKLRFPVTKRIFIITGFMQGFISKLKNFIF